MDGASSTVLNVCVAVIILFYKTVLQASGSVCPEGGKRERQRVTETVLFP